MDMIVAETDTSFLTLDWSMAELIRNPRVMKKALEEVRYIANGDDMIKEELLHKMSYLRAVKKEVLRLHPPAPLLLPRESMQDCQIQGYYIPKQRRIMINAWAIGRDNAYWEAPEEFMPERLLGSDMDFKENGFSIEDMDMEETPGLVSSRKQKLELVLILPVLHGREIRKSPQSASPDSVAAISATPAYSASPLRSPTAAALDPSFALLSEFQL